MNPAQTKLFWRTWQAAAKAHGWNSKAGIVTALANHHAGKIWESPALHETLDQIYQHAAFLAVRADRDVTADDLRHGVTVVAVGRHVSSKKFTNADFDKVLALLRLLAEPTNLDNLLAAQNGREAGERKRQLFFIGQFAPEYVSAIARDKFSHNDMDRLSLAELRQLALTLRNRPRARTRAETKSELQSA